MPRRSMAYVLLLCCLAACTTWHVEEGASPLLLIATEHPSRLRVTRSDSPQIVLENPQIAGSDTLVGQGHKEPTRVAVSDVKQVAIRRFSAPKTGAFVGLAVGLGGGLLAGTIVHRESQFVNVTTGDVVLLTALGGAVGAGLGALVGSAFRVDYWEALPRKSWEPAGHARVRRDRLTLGLAIAF
jgi:hypothetical protein